MKIAILTGGGDCPGLNAVIRAVVRMCEANGDTCLGFRNGWRGVVDGTYRNLTRKEVSGILHQGGTILGTSRTNLRAVNNGYQRAIEMLTAVEVDALIAVGGEDTQGVALGLIEAGFPNVVGCPKTIDNDLYGTDYTFGFDTAVHIATEALDRLHTTAEAHQRVIILEVMGRHAGWIALHSGLAGGADVIMIPEVAMSMAEVCSWVKRRQDIHNKHFSLIVVAEGARIKDIGAKEVADSEKLDAFGHVKLGGVGQYVADQIEERLGVDCRCAVLGHIQRGGTPTARDRYLGLQFGSAAYEAAKNKQFGIMVGLRGTEIVPVPLAEVASKLKTVPEELYRKAAVFFG
ncbi:MAG: 6-phosphofructokinase [Planctomycetota bacterium]